MNLDEYKAYIEATRKASVLSAVNAILQAKKEVA